MKDDAPPPPPAPPSGPRGGAAAPPSGTTAESALVFEALRLNDRFNRELVEQFNVCPFARRAREQGEVARHVLLQRDAAIEPTLDLMAALAGDPKTAIGLLIFPRLALTPTEFDHFVQRARAADQTRNHGRPAFAAASFHPDYPCDKRSAQQLVTFFRRSPDPTIQLVRMSVLDAVRGGSRGKFVFDYTKDSWAELERRLATVSITERITDDNFAMVKRDGTAQLDAVYADIHADRKRTYAALRARGE